MLTVPKLEANDVKGREASREESDVKGILCNH
jgi:hypothetical protein